MQYLELQGGVTCSRLSRRGTAPGDCQLRGGDAGPSCSYCTALAWSCTCWISALSALSRTKLRRTRVRTLSNIACDSSGRSRDQEAWFFSGFTCRRWWQFPQCAEQAQEPPVDSYTNTTFNFMKN